MKLTEYLNLKQITTLAIAIIILTMIIGFKNIISLNYEEILTAFLFALIIITVSVYSKKVMANLLDADVKHEIWNIRKYPTQNKFKKAIPVGIIIPILLTLITNGIFKFMAILTYETQALKRRAAKRFGFYSFTEMTEFHNAVIGASGITAMFILSIIAYLIPIAGLESLARLAAYYAFFNMLPISKLDGAQIFFGSRILYFALAIITLIFTAYALLLI